MGCVTRFRVRNGFLARYPVRVAGARAQRELWVPAEEMDEFNANIVGPIAVVSTFRGTRD